MEAQLRNVQRMECACVEEWYPVTPCSPDIPQAYSYGLWVHPGCVQHTEHLASMQEMIKELRGELD